MTVSPESVGHPAIESLTSATLSEATSRGRRGHRDIYDHVAQKVVPFVDEADCPPLQVIVYAIRNILFPTLLHSEIRDLLTLLAHAECVRRKASTSIHNFESAENGHIGSTREPRNNEVSSRGNTLERAKTSLEGEMRAMYREIVTGFPLVDVYETWFSPNSATVEELMRIYFPSVDEDRHLGSLFHRNLSDEEQDKLQEAANACLNLLERYVSDEEAGSSIDPCSEAARKKYPPLADEDYLVDLTEVYLHRLEKGIAQATNILEGTRNSRQ